MWRSSALLAAACLTLLGCAAQPRPAAPPEEAALSPLKRKILALATHEWDYFGRQRVVYQEREESIPHVGLWEDDDAARSYRVNRYWRAVDRPELAGRDCREPWSAAFISWVMSAAGVSPLQFPPSQAHWVYLTYLLRRANQPASAFIPHTTADYRPRPGDLICAGRGEAAITLLRYPTRLNLLEGALLHCDIVIASDGRTLEAIGGNVRNSVSKSILTLDAKGRLQPTLARPWFLALENRL